MPAAAAAARAAELEPADGRLLGAEDAQGGGAGGTLDAPDDGVEPAAHRRDRGGVPHAEGLQHGQRVEWLRHIDYPCASR